MTHRSVTVHLVMALLVAVGLLVFTASEARAQSCGNGSCQTAAGEDCSTCSADCGVCPPTCGDASCDAGETCSSCPADCGACCGDGTCAASEDCSSCAADCGACTGTCGDGTCDVGETCSTCASDCGACTTCGDGTCEVGEDCATCPADCSACVCGDGTCDGTEDCSSCASDCGACTSCGDGTCDPAEDSTTCPADCTTSRNDFASCPFDLPACTASSNDCCYRDFAAGSLIIPMDRCHQAVETATGSKRKPPTAINDAFCADPGTTGDNGMFHTYGLAYRLMQAGIPIYWTVNPTKDPPSLTDSQNTNSQTYNDRDIDFWVLSNGGTAPASGGTLTACSVGCTPPVLRVDPDTLATVSSSYNYEEFPTRGASFIIDAADRTAFDAFWANGIASGDSNYDFRAVDMYEIQSGAEIVYLDYRTSAPNYSEFNGGSSAPVAATLDYEPPRLARESPAGVSTTWLGLAKLAESASYPDCKTGLFSPSTAVYCDLTDDDMEQGFLVTGAFDWAWVDNWNPSGGNCSAGTTQGMMNQLNEFMRAKAGVKEGNSVMFMEGSVGVAESCSGNEPLGASGGLDMSNQTPTEPMIIRYPRNLFSQYGDIPSAFASGSVGKWGYSTNGYQSLTTLVRLLTEDTGTACSNHLSTGACDDFSSSGDMDDIAAYARFEDQTQNGVVFYMGGRNISQSSNMSHLRMVLNAFLALPTGLGTDPPVSYSTIEVTRSSPVVATVDGIEAQYQGTIDVIDPPKVVTKYSGSADDSTFRFPHFTGHMRAIDTSILSSTAADFSTLSPIFDAATGIPAANAAGCTSYYTNACRTVFTNTAGGTSVDKVFFHTGNVAQLKPLMAPSLTDAEAQTLISRVLAGRDDDNDGVYESALGGVDRATVAVIEDSPIIANGRPTMVYFGGLDGMLHAVCAEALGPCSAKGQELWAYIPRTQLPWLNDNLQRVDGSVKVADVFGTYNGTKQFRTVMTFQIGAGVSGFPDAAPAVVAIDITDPTQPDILWDYSTPSSRGTFELGVGLGLAMAPVQVGTDIKHYTFAQTNNGGTGGTGFVIKAFDTLSGSVAWTTTHAYANPPRSQNGDIAVPSTAIPGGVSAFSSTQGNAADRVVAPSLYGDVWLYNAEDGLNVHNTVPVFRFSSNFHPIGAPVTVYVDNSGDLTILAVSGGYHDPTSVLWSPAGTQQYAVAFPADQASVPIDETSSDLSFRIDFSTNERAFAQAVVAGGEIFIVTDTSDINSADFGVNTSNTGRLMRFDTSGSSLSTTVILPGGAGSVDVTSTGVVHSGSGKAAQKEDFSGTFNANGESTELSFAALMKRGLWLSR